MDLSADRWCRPCNSLSFFPMNHAGGIAECIYKRKLQQRAGRLTFHSRFRSIIHHCWWWNRRDVCFSCLGGDISTLLCLLELITIGVGVVEPWQPNLRLRILTTFWSLILKPLAKKEKESIPRFVSWCCLQIRFDCTWAKLHWDLFGDRPECWMVSAISQRSGSVVGDSVRWSKLKMGPNKIWIKL